jgi:hypothetical protein
MNAGALRSHVLARKPLATVPAACRGLARSSAGRTKQEKEALIMRLRQKEEETKRYGAPLGQVATARPFDRDARAMCVRAKSSLFTADLQPTARLRSCMPDFALALQT